MSIKSNRYFLLNILICGLAFVSCENSTQPDQNPIKNDSTVVIDSIVVVTTKGIIPTAVGNYWIYTDSNSVVYDTVRIDSSKVYKGFEWWILNSSNFPADVLTDRFAIRNDSIFIIEYNFSNEVIHQVFIPPADTPKVYSYIYGGDTYSSRKVTSVNKPIKVPAGKFNKYISYEMDWGFIKDSIDFVQGIGIVSRLRTVTNYPDSSVIISRRYLKSYNIKNK